MLPGKILVTRLFSDFMEEAFLDVPGQLERKRLGIIMLDFVRLKRYKGMGFGWQDAFCQEWTFKGRPGAVNILALFCTESPPSKEGGSPFCEKKGRRIGLVSKDGVDGSTWTLLLQEEKLTVVLLP